MLDVANIRISLDQLDGTEATEDRVLRRAVQRKLRLAADDLADLEPRKRSVDARKKASIRYTYTVRIKLRGGDAAEAALLGRLGRRHADKDVRPAKEDRFHLPAPPSAQPTHPPVVVGAGCAGLFCALALAKAGLEPILVERGQDATRRTQAIQRFNRTGVLDPQSNIQFGLGGAGTFSDGKLGTGTKSLAHRFILETFVRAGAQRQILWDAKPHVGSDVLPQVVTRICQEIQDAGGTVLFGTRLVGLGVRDGRVASVTLAATSDQGDVREEVLACSQVVMACGHSARDVFELLRDTGVTLERKTFAMGVRIEHLQAAIDRAQYGPSAGHPALGPSPYKLVAHLDGGHAGGGGTAERRSDGGRTAERRSGGGRTAECRSGGSRTAECRSGGGRTAFSFCMCPGGYVVAAASEPGGVVTNGMSLSDRGGTNANSGLLANVFPEDLPGDDVLAGMALQRSCERKAFDLGGGGFVAPAQLVGDFLAGRPSTGPGDVVPTYPRGVAWSSMDLCLPGYITDTLRGAIPLMDQRLRGFAAEDAVLTGVETRSSSPVRVTRDEVSLQSVSTVGLWPCGEGAGYAGGIMSAATDGLRVAQALVDSLRR